MCERMKDRVSSFLQIDFEPFRIKGALKKMSQKMEKDFLNVGKLDILGPPLRKNVRFKHLKLPQNHCKTNVFFY